MPGFVLDNGHTAENKAAHGTPILEKGDTINKETNTIISDRDKLNKDFKMPFSPNSAPSPHSYLIISECSVF